MPRLQEKFEFTIIHNDTTQEFFDTQVWECLVPVLKVQLKAYGFDIYYKPKRNDFTKANPFSYSEEIKETNMLDPEIYAVGTVHKHNNGNMQYRIIARNIKTTEFKSGVAMVIIDHNKTYPSPTTVCQETGVFYDGSEAGLYVAPKKHKGWINIYKDWDSKTNRECVHNSITTYIYKTKSQALDCVAPRHKHIACIEIEYEEGQGL